MHVIGTRSHAVSFIRFHCAMQLRAKLHDLNAAKSYHAPRSAGHFGYPHSFPKTHRNPNLWNLSFFTDAHHTLWIRCIWPANVIGNIKLQQISVMGLRNLPTHLALLSVDVSIRTRHIKIFRIFMIHPLLRFDQKLVFPFQGRLRPIR